MNAVDSLQDSSNEWRVIAAVCIAARFISAMFAVNILTTLICWRATQRWLRPAPMLNWN